jgi:hypothetical protein
MSDEGERLNSSHSPHAPLNFLYFFRNLDSPTDEDFV